MKLNELASILSPCDHINVYEENDIHQRLLHNGEVRHLSDELGERTVLFANMLYQGTLDVCLAEKED